MYARSTTIKADPRKLGDGLAFVRDQVLPTITGMDGCAGLSMLADPTSGYSIVTTSWATEETLTESGGAVRGLRERAAELMGGQPRVEEWQVVLMHRMGNAPEGACCRVGWIDLNDVDVDLAVEGYRALLVPRLEALDGFRSVSLMADPTHDRACGTLTFDSRATLDSSREVTAELRDRAQEKLGIRFTEVNEFDLLIHHLRVPELV